MSDQIDDDQPSRAPTHRKVAAASTGRRSFLTGMGVASALAAVPIPAAFAQQQVSTASPAAPPGPAGVAEPGPIEVTARPLTGFGKAAGVGADGGRLEFAGGLVLNSPDRRFGGWSGLLLSDDGQRLLAVSDRAAWMTSDIQYTAGRPVALANPVMGEIPALGGLPLRRGRDRDAESLALLQGTVTRGTVLIGFERNHRIGRFPVTERGLGPPLGYIRMPPEARQMKSNKGLEAVAVLRGGPMRGAVLAFAEELHDAGGNHTGWIWTKGFNGTPQPIGVVDIGGYAITDAASMPDGSLLLLERRFRWLEGVKCRIRHIRAGDVKPGALLDGTVLLDASMTAEIDNMEGLALSRDAKGRIVLTLLSDNNFNSFLQRTLLLQFVLTDTTPIGASRK
jgi:hypothetical protein